MRIYCITLDSEPRYHIAETLMEAIEKDFIYFKAENIEWIVADAAPESEVREYYESILEQTVLIGEIYEPMLIDSTHVETGSVNIIDTTELRHEDIL